MESKKVNVFREESLEKISAPEQITDYLRITNPSTWLIIFALILLFVAVIIWGSVGKLETVTNVTAVVNGGKASITIIDTSKGQVKTGMPLRIGSEEYIISSVISDEYGKIIASAPVHISDGVYNADIVIESISPIDFLFE